MMHRTICTLMLLLAGGLGVAAYDDAPADQQDKGATAAVALCVAAMCAGHRE